MRNIFWERVIIQIKDQNTTQLKLATLIGISYQRLRNWIYRNYIPDAVTACEIAENLGTTVEYLVWGENRNPVPSR